MKYKFCYDNFFFTSKPKSLTGKTPNGPNGLYPSILVFESPMGQEKQSHERPKRKPGKPSKRVEEALCMRLRSTMVSANPPFSQLPNRASGTLPLLLLLLHLSPTLREPSDPFSLRHVPTSFQPFGPLFSLCKDQILLHRSARSCFHRRCLCLCLEEGDPQY